MQKTIKYLIPLFLCLLTLFAFLPNSVSGLSYYNWIQNGDFEAYVNICEDGGFESGGFNNGVLYGNWSSLNATYDVVIAEYPYSGVYSGKILQRGLRYNFTYPEEVLGADVESFEFWARPPSSTLYVNVTIHYSDGSLDIDTWSSAGAGYKEVDVLTVMSGIIDPLKYVVAFDINKHINAGCWVDEVVFRVGGVQGQETIDFYTYPWFCGGDPNQDNVGLDHVVGRSGLQSAFWQYGESTVDIVQNINYLDSDSVYFIDMYAYTNVLVDVRVVIIYSDATSDIAYESIDTLSTWVHLIFSGFIDPNKYIIQIQIALANNINGRVNIDDVGLWASVVSEEATQRFSFTISPTPILIQGHQVTAYLSVTYHFYGFIRNATGGYSENGTFNVHHNLGITTGNIVLGLFNFSITARSDVIQTYENFGIICTLEATVEEFNVVFEWRRYGTDEPPEPVGVQPWIGTPAGANFIVMIFLVFVPSAILGFKFSERNQGLLGFMIGLAIMSSIAYLSGLMPLWFLFVMILAFIVFILYALKGGL